MFQCFEVSTPYQESLMEMERSAICLFGIRNYGVSVSGYVNHPTKGLCIWLQQRSFTKQTWPGMLQLNTTPMNKEISTIKIIYV